MRRAPFAAIVAATIALGAQSPPPVFEVEERVTAVDVMVGIERGPLADPEKSPQRIDSGDLQVLVDGEPRALIGAETPSAGGLDRWRVVLYFDRQLASTLEIRAAAAALAQAAPALTALGPVEIVVAEEVAAVRLSATHDLTLLRAVLDRLALDGVGEHALLALRAEALAARAEGPDDADENGEASADPRLAWALEERELLRARHDELVATLVTAGEAGSQAGRAVILVGGPVAPSPDGAGGSRAPGPETDARRLATALAAHGWTAIVFDPPAPAADLARGVTLGKLRWRGFVGTWEEDRDPERARAYVDLGRARDAAGDLDGAAEAFESAVRHFADDRKTAGEQAEALFELGQVELRRGDADAAAIALQVAAGLDPERSHPVATLLEQLEDDPGPAALAAETGGAVAASGPDLAAAIAELSRRVRVTFQSAGEPDPELVPLEVRYRDDAERARGTRWTRTATADRVAEARVRRALRLLEESPDGLPFAAAIDDVGDGRLRLTVVSEEGPEWLGGRRIRVSWAVASPGRAIDVHHRLLTVGSEWSHSTLFDEPGRDTLAAVVVEDLATGTWGEAVIEVPN